MPCDSTTHCASILPQPRQLAAVGALLCMYRAQQGAALVGWSRAVRAESIAGLDSDGLRESLWFYDRDDRPCWRLYLLPDSDFMAWDRLARALPARVEQEVGGGLCQRLWQQLAEQLRGDNWCACALRLHSLQSMKNGTNCKPVLAASLAPLSTLGTVAATRIAWAEGTNGAVFVAEERHRRAATPECHSQRAASSR